MGIKRANSDRIGLVYSEAQKLVWEGLGIEAAFLTDLSCLFDFCPSPEELEKVARLVGHPVTGNSFVVDLAEEYANRSGL